MIVNCPGCGEGITIPGEAAVPRSMQNAVQAAETDPVDEGAYGQFVVYGDCCIGPPEPGRNHEAHLAALHDVMGGLRPDPILCVSWAI